MSYETIEYVVENGVATIRLNRPEKMNSFTAQMHKELSEAVKTVAGDKSLRCLVITANGKAFSAGQDLGERYKTLQDDSVPDLGESLRKNYNPLVNRIANLSIPVVCAINGVAAGAGVGIALACDVVLAARSAKFVFAFSKVGLVADSGCTWSLIRTVGLIKAKALAMLGETISAEDAEAMGLVYRVVDDEQLAEVTEKTIQSLLEKPAYGLTLNKRAFNQAADSGLDEQMAREADYQSLASRHPDYREAVSAFVEKRKPKFQADK